MRRGIACWNESYAARDTTSLNPLSLACSASIQGRIVTAKTWNC